MGILNDGPGTQERDFCGYPIISGLEDLNERACRNGKLILAIGDNKARKKVWEGIESLDYELARAIHSSAQIGKNVSIGPGTVIMANSAVNSGAKIGESAIINTGATVDHDCVLEDYVHISPGTHLAGNVYVGELTHIGMGVSVVQGVRIGKGVIIGAGAVVIDDIPDNVTAVGVPAKVSK